jgi:hypothetical protein
MVAKDPDVSAVILEDTGFPPHVYSIHVPVFTRWGNTTIATQIQFGLRCNKFTGWV